MNNPNPNSKNQTLLLVEDDYDIRAMLVMLLEMEGYQVLKAAHGREALTLLEAGHRPHLILLDLMMPVMNGWQFREAVLQVPEFATIPILVVSGDGRDAAQYMAEHVSGFLKKPIDLSHLLFKINEIALPAM